MPPAHPDALLVLHDDDAGVAAARARVERDARVVRPLCEPFDVLHELHDQTWRRVAIVARDVGQVRLAMPVLFSVGRARRVIVLLAQPGGAGIDPGRHVEVRSMTVSEDGREWDVRLPSPAAVATTVAWLVARSARTPLRPMSGLRVAVADAAGLAWCIGDASSRTTANADDSWRGDATRGDPIDVVVGQRPEVAAARFAVDVTHRCPPVDLAVTNPRGFRADDNERVAQLVVTAGTDGDDIRFVAGSKVAAGPVPGGRLDAADIAALRPFTYVDASALHHVTPRTAAHLLVQLAAAGVPILVERVPAAVKTLLHAELVSALEDATRDSLRRRTMREAHSVRARRAVFRHHTHAAAWNGIRAEMGRSPLPRPTVSVQLSTRRIEFVEHAVHSVARQQGVDLELILTTHGFTLPAERLAAIRDDFPFPLTVLTAPADALFGEVLNAAVRAASGELVTKMDDDDFYGPHHLEDLTHTLAWSGATLAGALHLFTYVAGADMTVERRARPQRETEAAHVPGGTMMIERADLLALGGWRPVATGSIDLALSHAVRESGGTLHLMHGLGFVLCRHGYNHAWSVDDDNFVATSRQRWPGLHPPPELGPAAAFDGQVAALGRVRPA